MACPTPTGNPLNPFFFGPLLLLQACFRPSIVLLRIVATGQRRGGAGAELVAVPLGLRSADGGDFDAGPGAAADRHRLQPFRLGCQPIAVGDAAGMVFFAGRGAFSRPARPLTAAAIVALLAAVLVHPTNVFAGAAIAASLAVRWRQFRVDPRRLAVLALAALALILWAANLVRMQGNVGGGGCSATSTNSSIRTANPHAAVLYANLFSGETVYQYISGGTSWLPWGVGLALVWAVLLAAAWRLWQCGTAADRVLVAAWLLELAGFVVLAGPEGMLPGQERYAICLIAPAVIVAARGAAVWWSGAGRPRTSIGGRGPRPGRRLVRAGRFPAALFPLHRADRRTGPSNLSHRRRRAETSGAGLYLEASHGGRHLDRGRRVGGAIGRCGTSRWRSRTCGSWRRSEAAAEPELALARAEGRAWHVRFCEGEKLQGEQILDYSGRPVLDVSRW